MVPNKKAQISMQFNWIFVIIIGAVLIGFFFSAIQSGAKSSEKKISVSLAKHFETILFTTGQVPGTFKTYETPQVDLTFTCDDSEGLYNYKVGDLKVRDTKYDVVFAPHKLVGKSIITWTQKWSVPFSVGTFLYVTNKQHLFVIYKGDSKNHQIDQVLEVLPENLSLYIVDKNNDFPSDELNFDQYTYVFFADDLPNIDPSKIIRNKNKPVTIVVFYPAKNDVFSYGDVFIMTPKEFRQFSINAYPKSSLIGLSQSMNASSNQPAGRAVSRKELIHSGYFGKASFFGAVFSSSKEEYDCNMRKAFHELTILTILQKNKIRIGKNYISTSCSDALGFNKDLPGPLQTLDSLQNLIYIPSGTSSSVSSAKQEIKFNYLDLPKIYSLGLELQKQNDILQTMSSCPTIY